MPPASFQIEHSVQTWLGSCKLYRFPHFFQRQFEQWSRWTHVCCLYYFSSSKLVQMAYRGVQFILSASHFHVKVFSNIIHTTSPPYRVYFFSCSMMIPLLVFFYHPRHIFTFVLTPVTAFPPALYRNCERFPLRKRLPVDLRG